MKKKMIEKISPAGLALAAFATAALLSIGQPRLAHAEDCTIAKPADELEAAEVDELYGCISQALVEGYQKGDDPVAADYRNWKPAAVRPAAPGPHGDRFLMTFVNDVGHAEYVKYLDEGAKMPAGTVIAKESFKVNKKGVAKKGPLFIMTKLEDGGAADFGDWLYSAVQPNGKEMKVKQKFCHDCHGAFEDQDALGYPDPDVRLSN